MVRKINLVLCVIIIQSVMNATYGAYAKKLLEKNHRHAITTRSKAFKTPVGVRSVLLLSKTKVKLPKNLDFPKPTIRTFYGIDFKFTVYSRKFMRGEAVLCEFEQTDRKDSMFEIQVFFNNKQVMIDKCSWGYRGIFGIPPDSTYMWATISLIVQDGGSRVEYYYPLKIHDVKFPEYKKPLQLGEYSDADLFSKKPWLREKVALEKEKKEKIFATIIPYQIRGRLAHPRDYHKITSSFYAMRLYQLYEIVDGQKRMCKSKKIPHLGVDLWGNVGSPVYAIADGKVVLAEEMFYEGNQVIINHGGGIFSRYMHLSAMTVKEGDAVSAGQIIGKVGETGMVTGAHLHVGVCINGVYVDPISLLYLPVKD